MNFQHIESFGLVAQLGSFSKAAEALYISTPAVIQQINLLERDCGVKLLDRHHRGVSLTEAGQSLYQDSQKLQADWKAALERARKLGKEKQVIRVGTADIFKPRHLLNLMAKIEEQGLPFQFEFPTTKESLSGRHHVQTLGKECDLIEAIYCDIGWQGQCQFYPLGQTPLAVAVRQSHPLAQKKSLKLEDLIPYTLLMLGRNILSQMDLFRDDLGALVPKVTIQEPAVIGQETFMLCELHPYVLITETIFQDVHPNLVTIPLETPHTLPYGLVYSNQPSPVVQDFLDQLPQLMTAPD